MTIKRFLSDRFGILIITRKSIFYSWLLSYVSILLIPVLISGIVYYKSGEIIENETNNANLALLQQIKQGMDSQMRDIEKLILQIAWNPRLQGLIYLDGALEERHRYVITQIMQDFKVYKASNGFIDDFYVYFKNTGFALLPSGYYSPEVVYQTVHTNTEISYEEWSRLINMRHNGSYIHLSGINPEEKRNNNIFFAQSLPLNSIDQSDATIVIMLNEARFLESIKNIKWVNQGIVLIIDKNSRVLASTQSMNLPPILQYEKLEKASGLLTTTINGVEHTVSYIKSEVTDLIYISIIPSSTFMEKADYLRNITLAGIFLFLLIGGLVAYAYARKNYNPVRELTQVIMNRAGVPAGGAYDEFGFLKNAITNTLDEKDKISKELRQHSAVLRSNFLARLLKGRLENSIPIHDSLSSFYMQFYSNHFAVMLFVLQDFGELFSDSENNNDIERLRLVQFILSNVVEEMVNQEHQGYMTEVDEIMTCLVNFKERGLDTGKEAMVQIARKAQQYLQEKFHITIKVFISDIHETFSGIPEAFQEALEAMEYKMVIGSEEIVQYDDIKPTALSYDYPLETELQLVNFIRTGDFEQARNILFKVFENNFTTETLSLQMVRCLLFDLISTMIKTINKISSEGENTFFDRLNPVERLLGYKTVPELKEQMLYILREVCSFVEAKNRNRNNELKSDVMKYIELHYYDVNLSISNIGERFQMTPSYLSKIYKEMTGEGLLDTINNIRLKKAKELLKDQSLSIEDTAVKVGYYNSQALIRAFKKYEGVTPGRYREMV